MVLLNHVGYNYIPGNFKVGSSEDGACSYFFLAIASGSDLTMP